MAGCVVSMMSPSNIPDPEEILEEWPKLTKASGLQLPDDIAIVILMFEGSVLAAYQRDYIGTLYSDVFRTFFGTRAIQESTPDKLLPYYCAFVTHVIASKKPQFRYSMFGRRQPTQRARKCRIHMKKWKTITNRYDMTNVLNQQVAITSAPLADYFACARRRFAIRDIGRGMIYW